MANRQKRPWRWDHLNDFQPDGAGRYVYTGKVYEFEGGKDAQRRCLILSGSGALLLLFCAVLPECLPPAQLSGSFITVLPWAAHLFACLSVMWGTVRLIAGANEMRAYRLVRSAKALPRRSLLAGITGLVTLAAQTGYGFLIHWSGDGWNTAVRLTSSLCGALCGFLLFRFHRKAVWREKNSLSSISRERENK